MGDGRWGSHIAVHVVAGVMCVAAYQIDERDIPPPDELSPPLSSSAGTDSLATHRFRLAFTALSHAPATSYCWHHLLESSFNNIFNHLRYLYGRTHL